ncbi:restriction endonuclease subunit R, partial [Dietzia sp. SLG510A3-30A2]|nr:restriction endonuclease subunit R [Dietzia sp. SLG510A3-30A2]
KWACHSHPKYYDKMSELLDAIIEQRRQQAIDYQEYLAKLLDAAKQLGAKESDTKYPDWADNGARRALIDFGWPDAATPIQVDTAILTSKPHDWVGNPMKEKVVKRAISRTLPDDFSRLDELFELVKARDEYR